MKTREEQADKPLTEQELKFVAYFVGGYNATNAVLKAGYETKNPGAKAGQLKQRANIEKAIKLAFEDVEKSANISKLGMTMKLREIVFNESPDGSQKYPIESKTTDQIRAIEQLCKMFGYNLEKEGQNVNINTNSLNVSTVSDEAGQDLIDLKNELESEGEDENE